MSSLLSAVTSRSDETAASRRRERPPDVPTSGGRGGSRRRTIALAAAGLGAALLLRRRRANERGSDSRDSFGTTTGNRGASSGTGTQKRSIGGRLVRTVAGIAASVLVRRAIRRWRKR